ncbi:MAG: hypothetical protein WD398_14925 [Cyclobacteriaceae bacterium]
MDSRGNIYVILRRNKLLYYDQEKGVFSEKNLPIQIPVDYHPNTLFEDTQTGYFWIGCEEGLAVFDFYAGKTYHKGNNPLHLPFLDDPNLVQVADYFIDKSRNHWLVFWNPHQRFGSFNERSENYSPGAMTLETITLDPIC